MVVVVALALAVQIEQPQRFGGVDVLLGGVFGQALLRPVVQLVPKPDADGNGVAFFRADHRLAVEQVGEGVAQDVFGRVVRELVAVAQAAAALKTSLSR